jgi:hypothetical protein
MENMTAKKYHFIPTILLIIVLCANLLNVQVARADGETPTEPPAPTEVVTELPVVEVTPEPIEVTPVLEESTATPVEEILTQVPEATEVIVLDQSGEVIPLATQEAVEIVEIVDPIWCPAGVLPGGAGSGCSSNYGTIAELINNMISNTTAYTQNGVIYFTATADASIALTSSSLGTSDFNTLNDFNITLQGGWNGSIVSPSLSGQTNFGSNSITIGSTGNPWAGNVALNDMVFNAPGVGTITVYTTTGDITLSNVDVLEQQGTAYTAFLNSSGGAITVQNGSSFDGNATNYSRGFYATTTGAGQITVSDTSFSDSQRNGNQSYDGATLSAPIVTLTNVLATGNDGDGITINNANIVTLNNVIASNNGTESGANGFVGNSGSGVSVNGNPGSSLIIIGGAFTNNQRYGVDIGNSANTTVYVQSNPTCTGNDSNAAGLGCSNDTFVFDNTAPVIVPTLTGTAGLNGWYKSNVSVTWSFADAESGVRSSTGCTASNLAIDTAGTTLTCSASNNAGLSNSASVAVKIDKTAPTIGLHADEAVTTNNALGTNVTYSLPTALDNFDASPSVTCSPASGSLFSVGNTTVSCNGTDQAGNPALPTTFVVQVTYSTLPPTGTPTTNPVSTATQPSSATQPSVSQHAKQKQSQSSTEPSALILPLTGGELMDLGCNSVLWAFGIKLSFLNFCDHQTTIHNVDANHLPGPLPSGLSLLTGVDVTVLNKGQKLTEFPNGSGIEMDFPLSNQSADKLAVLYWNGSTWTEVSEQIDPGDVSQMINSTAGNGLYQLAQDTGALFHTILTAHKTGVFVLVKK